MWCCGTASQASITRCNGPERYLACEPNSPLHSYILHACPPQLALVVLLVAGIHFIEAYGLNPAIYSAHLKLHPLLVLSVLVIAEHSLGVWGLLLAGALVI